MTNAKILAVMRLAHDMGNQNLKAVPISLPALLTTEKVPANATHQMQWKVKNQGRSMGCPLHTSWNDYTKTGGQKTCTRMQCASTWQMHRIVSKWLSNNSSNDTAQFLQNTVDRTLTFSVSLLESTSRAHEYKWVWQTVQGSQFKSAIPKRAPSIQFQWDRVCFGIALFNYCYVQYWVTVKNILFKVIIFNI